MSWGTTGTGGLVMGGKGAWIGLVGKIGTLLGVRGRDWGLDWLEGKGV